MKFLFICSHQIQNLIPLFVELEKKKDLDFKVLYWVKLDAFHFDHEFNSKINFNVNRFKGYRSHCLSKRKENSNSIFSFFNKFYITLKLLIYLFKERQNYETVLIYGYYFPHIISSIFLKLLKKKIIIRSISYNLGNKNFAKKILRNIYYRFSNIFIDEFWSVCKLNTDFFKTFGVDQKKIYLIESSQLNKNFVFINENDFINQRHKIISQNKILTKQKIILFAGKLIKKKRPLLLLEAFIESKISNEWLLLISGDGYYRDKVLDIIDRNKKKNILFVGFQNIREILTLYSLSDIIVLPSDYGETHGNVLLEATQFNCALVASDRVGLYPELINNNLGLVFDAEKKSELIKKLEHLTNDKNLLEKLKKNSLEYSKKIQPEYIANKIFKLLNKNEI